MARKYSRRKAPRRKPKYSSRKRNYSRRSRKSTRKRSKRSTKTYRSRKRFTRKSRGNIRSRRRGVLDTAKKNITRIKFVTGEQHTSLPNVLAELKPLIFSTTHKDSSTPLTSFVEYWATNPLNSIPYTSDRLVRMHRHSDTITVTGLYINLSNRLSAGSEWKIRVMVFEHREVPEVPYSNSRMLYSDDGPFRYPVGLQNTVSSAETGYGEAARCNLPWDNWQDSRNVTQVRRDDIMKGRPLFAESKITMIHDHIYVQRNMSSTVKTKHINVSKNLHRVYKFPSKYNTTFTRGAAVPNIFPNPEPPIEDAAVTGVYRNALAPFKKLYVVILAHATVPGPFPRIEADSDVIMKSHKPDIDYPLDFGEFPAHRHSTHEDYKHRVTNTQKETAPPEPPPPPPPRRSKRKDKDSASVVEGDGDGDDAPDDDHGDDPPGESYDADPIPAINPSNLGPQWAWLEVSPQIDFCFRNNADSVPVLS